MGDQDLAKKLIDGLTSTSKMMMDTISKLSAEHRGLMETQQKIQKEQMDRAFQLMEFNKKLSERNEELTKGILCLEDERVFRRGRSLYDMVQTEKQRMSTKYTISAAKSDNFVSESTSNQLTIIPRIE